MSILVCVVSEDIASWYAILLYFYIVYICVLPFLFDGPEIYLKLKYFGLRFRSKDFLTIENSWDKKNWLKKNNQIQYQRNICFSTNIN